MTLYIQDENYHFDGFLSGVIVDNQRTAIFSKNGIEDFNLDIDFNSLNWYVTKLSNSNNISLI